MDIRRGKRLKHKIGAEGNGKNEKMGKTCLTCGYCEKETRKKDSARYCSNGESEYCAEWVKADQTCDAWTPKGKEYGR